MSDTKPEIEGEGSHSAARKYNEDTKEFVENADMKKHAEDAKKAVEGDDTGALSDAEEKGREAARGEDPKLRQP